MHLRRLTPVLVLAALAGCGTSAAPQAVASATAPGASVTPIPTPTGITPPPATPAPTAAPTPPPTPVPTQLIAPPQPAIDAAAVLAVAAATFPQEQSGYGECGRPGPNGTQDWSPCPFTPRLMQRLAQNPTGGTGGGADPLCRCQNAVSPTYSATATVAPGSGVAHVVLYSGDDRLDLVEIVLAGRLLVDDTECTGGGPATSIYAANPPPCG